jgi:hypothetical protein
VFREIIAIYAEYPSEKNVLCGQNTVFLILKQVIPQYVEGLKSNASLSSMTAGLENQLAFALAMPVVLCSSYSMLQVLYMSYVESRC